MQNFPRIPTNTVGTTKGRPCAGFGGSLPLEIQAGEIHVKSQPFLNQGRKNSYK